jgi:uncharacterized protein YhfF
MKSEIVSKFWQEFCRQNQNVSPNEDYQVWFFGDSQEMSVKLANFVIFGTKRATASLSLINKLQPENAPINNGYSIVTDFAGKPLCIIQTTEIREIPFLEVDYNFAKSEGEGDENIEDWRKGHRDYFTKECKEAGFEFNETMLVCCERFELIYTEFA